jgi:2Fe-2S ferredoxin
MPKITFIDSDGLNSQEVEAAVGITAMEAARNAGITSVAGDCGGACICGTCHVHVDPSWFARVGAPIDIEVATMEFSEDVRPESRLACRIIVTEELDGLVLHIPAEE